MDRQEVLLRGTVVTRPDAVEAAGKLKDKGSIGLDLETETMLHDPVGSRFLQVLEDDLRNVMDIDGGDGSRGRGGGRRRRRRVTKETSTDEGSNQGALSVHGCWRPAVYADNEKGWKKCRRRRTTEWDQNKKNKK